MAHEYSLFPPVPLHNNAHDNQPQKGRSLFQITFLCNSVINDPTLNIFVIEVMPAHWAPSILPLLIC